MAFGLDVKNKRINVG